MFISASKSIYYNSFQCRFIPPNDLFNVDIWSATGMLTLLHQMLNFKLMFCFDKYQYNFSFSIIFLSRFDAAWKALGLAEKIPLGLSLRAIRWFLND